MPEALKPVYAAFKLLFLLSAGGNAQARFASCDFVVEFGQTQFGQPLFMIDDTAALAHISRITGPLNVRNRASAIVISMAISGRLSASAAAFACIGYLHSGSARNYVAPGVMQKP
ncbi:MAG: hypothetical protein WA085_18315 [Sphingobium sp.]